MDTHTALLECSAEIVRLRQHGTTLITAKNVAIGLLALLAIASLVIGFTALAAFGAALLLGTFVAEITMNAIRTGPHRPLITNHGDDAPSQVADSMRHTSAVIHLAIAVMAAYLAEPHIQSDPIATLLIVTAMMLTYVARLVTLNWLVDVAQIVSRLLAVRSVLSH